ncbi:GGDEF domain-containing protein, partial [Eubacteriales bacterium OttesenSCG-928-N14]|nr:GGDEF domain-containing protein [Eubacteriales bacterium OttesenSCG-928-N14]
TLGLVLLCLITSLGMMTCLFLPDSPLFDYVVGICMASSIVANALLAQIILRLAGYNSKKAIALQRLYYIPPACIMFLALTNPIFGGLVSMVQKSADGLSYLIQSTDITTLLSAASSFALLLAFILPLIHIDKAPYNSRKVILILCASVLVPSIINNVEMVLEQQFAFNYHFGLSAIWIPIATICYVYFGYLRTSRNMAIQVTHDIYAVFDKWGVLVDSNDKGQEFFAAYGMGQSPTEEQFAKSIGLGQNSGLIEYEFEMTANGKPQYYSMSPFAISGGISQYCGNGYVIREITEFKERMQYLNILATVDPLTGAKNRRYFYDYGEHLLRRAAFEQFPVTLLMIDIDHFKLINDAHGHLVGDEVLKELCNVFEKNMRKNDEMFRYGGEEFIILCEDMDECAGQQMAARVLDAVNGHAFSTSAGVVPVTVSIGGYTFMPSVGDDVEQWLQVVDGYLYRAKENGRNRVEYHAV